jgi:hypothetical protein
LSPVMQMYLNNLTTNMAYEVKVRAATRSHVGERKLHVGDWSDTNAVFLQPGCEALRDFQPEKGWGENCTTYVRLFLAHLFPSSFYPLLTVVGEPLLNVLLHGFTFVYRKTIQTTL